MKILVQFEAGPNTRWLFSLDEVRKELERLARNVSCAMTEGPQPKVTAIVEEQTAAPALVLCAWCNPSRTEPGISHGICNFHKVRMEAELLKIKTEQPKETTCDLQP